MKTSRVIRWTGVSYATAMVVLIGGCGDPEAVQRSERPSTTEVAALGETVDVDDILRSFPREQHLHGYKVTEICTVARQRDCPRMFPGIGGFLSATRSGTTSDNSSIFITLHGAPRSKRLTCPTGRFSGRAKVHPDGSFTPGERGVGTIRAYAHEGLRGHLCLRTFVYLDPEGSIMEWADEAETVLRIGDWELHLTVSEGSWPGGEPDDDRLAIALTNELVSRLRQALR